MRRLAFATFLCFVAFICQAQTEIYERYDSALAAMNTLLKEARIGDFRKAVLLVERAYSPAAVNDSTFDRPILVLSTLVKEWVRWNSSSNYNYSDSLNILKNYAIFKVLKDTMKLQLPNGDIYKTLPYGYDYIDFDGQKDWTKMFVTKLLATHSGNCHNLPYLYKILADQVGASCWLSLAPNHIYIENRCRKFGWYNTELTSGCFPIDAWIMASGYLPVKAVQTGIYMDTLSNQEAVALCILDLAKGYEHRTRNYSDGFILKCCDLSLQYFPLNVQAMLLKTETLKHIYQGQQAKKDQRAKGTFSEMQSLYLRLFDLGYREMPNQMYMQWLQAVVKERDKYSNKQMKEAVQVQK